MTEIECDAGVTGRPRVQAVPEWVAPPLVQYAWMEHALFWTYVRARQVAGGARGAVCARLGRWCGGDRAGDGRCDGPDSVAGDGRADRVRCGVPRRAVPGARMVARSRDRAARQRRPTALVGTVVGLRLDDSHRGRSGARAKLGAGVHRRHAAGASTPPRGRVSRNGRSARGVRGDPRGGAGPPATRSLRAGGSARPVHTSRRRRSRPSR